MYGKFLKGFLIALSLSIFISPSLYSQKVLEEIIARVNSDIILKSEYEAEQKSLREELAQNLQGQQLEQAVQQRSKDILRDLIDNSLLVQQAKEMGLNADLEVVKQEERMRQQHNQQNPTSQITTIDDLEKAISAQMNLDEFKQRIRMFDTEKIPYIIEEGERAAEAQLPYLSRLLDAQAAVAANGTA